MVGNPSVVFLCFQLCLTEGSMIYKQQGNIALYKAHIHFYNIIP